MNKKITDYKNPFEAISEFESMLSRFTGAPYVITTDCCTHAMEMSLRLRPPQGRVSFPCRTYLSVLMTMHKLGIMYYLEDVDWKGCYQINGTQVWDCARLLEPGMYVAGQIQCISFGRTKPLEIGRGGCVLTDDADLALRLTRMRYDGRDILKYSPWADQGCFHVGFHYYMRPEEAIVGINKMLAKDFLPQTPNFYNYPDCRTLTIVD